MSTNPPTNPILGPIRPPQNDEIPVPPKLENTFNRMYLLTTNLLPNDFRPSVAEIGLTAQLTEEQAKTSIDAYIATLDHHEYEANLKEAYKQRLNSYSSYNNNDSARRACIEYDLKSLNGNPSGLDDDAVISQIATSFYNFVLRIHFYNLYSILVLLKQLVKDKAAGAFPQPIGAIGGVLFQNPLFNAYDATFHGPDGVHDAEPRGDMVGSVVKQKRGNGAPQGGWEVIKNIIGANARDNLLLAIRTSSIMPTNEQSDDISKAIGQRWESLTAVAGHQLLEPTDFERLICNIVMPEKVILSSSDLINSGNRYKIVEVKDSTDGVEKTRENARRVYGIRDLNNNFAISDCSGPTPPELHSLVGSADIVPGIDDVEEEVGDDEDDDFEGGGKSKSAKKKEKVGRVTSILSDILDSSSARGKSAFPMLKQIIGPTQDFQGYTTFLMPHTRWAFETKTGPVAGQILHIFQRTIINFSGPIPIYQLRFEAWRTEGENPRQSAPTVFLSASNFFELKPNDKSPGVNETIRYILAYATGTGIKDLDKQYARKMFSEKSDIKKFEEKAEKSKAFFDKFLNAFKELLDRFPANPNYKQFLGNVTLLRMAVLFRQKTMGDNLRLADTAYLNELLWYAQNKMGIAVEGTCDGFSGFKAMAANNNPVILCGAKKWGTTYKMFSSFTLDPADAARAALLQKKVMYVEKTQKLRATLERLRVDFIKFKNFQLDETSATVFANMQHIFIENGEEYLERVVVDEINKLNANIIKYKMVLDEAKITGSRLDEKKANYEIDNSNAAIREITQLVEASLSIIGLGLLMNTFLQNWLSYCEQFLDIWEPEIDIFISEIDEDRLVDDVVDERNIRVNECISLIPSTEEMDKTKVFYDICDKSMSIWREPNTLAELTTGLLTLTVKKDFSVAESKLKKLFDKGVPALLCQEKDTTVSYASLLKYRDILVSLEDMFAALKPQKVPVPVGQLPQIDMIFSSGILNSIAEEQFILWIKQNGYIQILPQSPSASPSASDTSVPESGVEEVEVAKEEEKIKTDEEEAEEKKLDDILRPPTIEEEEEPAKIEVKTKPIPVKKSKTSTLNKLLNAVKAVSSFRFLRSGKRVLRSGIVVVGKGGGIQQGGANFQAILSKVETLALKEIESLDIDINGYLPEDLSIYLPILFSYDFKPSEEMEGVQGEDDLTPEQFAEAFFAKLSEEKMTDEEEPEGWESYVESEVPNEVLTSCLDNIQDSLDNLLVAMDSAGELQVASDEEIETKGSPNEMVNGIDKLNKGLVDEGINAINKYLNFLLTEGEPLATNIAYLQKFLSGDDDESVDELTASFEGQQKPSTGEGTASIVPLLSSPVNANSLQASIEKREAFKKQEGGSLESEMLLRKINNKNSKYALVGIMLKFKSLTGVNLDDNNALSLCNTFDRFLLQTSEETTVKTFKEAILQKVEILFATLIGGENTLFGKIFKEKIPELFFKRSEKYGDDILRNRVIKFVVQDSYSIYINGYRNILELLTVCALLYNDDLLRRAVTELYFYDAGTAVQFLPPIDYGAPPSTPGVQDSPVPDEMFPEENEESIKGFYEDYYDALSSVDGTKLGPKVFPIPVKENTLPYLLLTLCKDGQSVPLVTPANVKQSFQFAAVCEKSILQPLAEYFWSDCCSESMQESIRDAVKYKLIMRYGSIKEKNIVKLLSSNLYCYLFGTCKTAKTHNGVIMDDVPGEIIELGLHQYTNGNDKDEEGNPVMFLSYSVAELQSIIEQFMRLPQYLELSDPVKSAQVDLINYLEKQQQIKTQLYNQDDGSAEAIRLQAELNTQVALEETSRKFIENNEKKTRKEWIDWAKKDISPKAVQLLGRPETSIGLMSTFMDDILNGVVSNYKYLSKKQKEELGIDGLAKAKDGTEEEGRDLTDQEKEKVKKVIREKPRTLIEFYNIFLYLVALENIENINVAKVSLLSEKIGSYLSEPTELLNDINSGLELNEPSVSFYRFFMGLFLILSEEKKVGFSEARKKSLYEIINGIIADYYANRDVKRELRRMVQENQEVMRVIEEIIADEEKEKEEGEIVEPQTQTLFQLSIDDSNREKYVKFLKSLLPPKLESLPPPPPPPAPDSPSGPPSDSDDDDDDESRPPSPATTPRASDGVEKEGEGKEGEGKEKKENKKRKSPTGDEPGEKYYKKDDDDEPDGSGQREGITVEGYAKNEKRSLEEKIEPNPKKTKATKGGSSKRTRKNKKH